MGGGGGGAETGSIIINRFSGGWLGVMSFEGGRVGGRNPKSNISDFIFPEVGISLLIFCVEIIICYNNCFLLAIVACESRKCTSQI